MALFPCNVGGGGTQYASGTFTSTTTNTTKCTCGFQPTYIAVFDPVTRNCNIYNADYNSSQYMYGSANGTSLKNLPSTGTNELASIDNDGFTMNKWGSAAGRTVYWFAVG